VRHLPLQAFLGSRELAMFNLAIDSKLRARDLNRESRQEK
jgi:hypothetical protein